MEIAITEWALVTDSSSVGAVRRSAATIARRIGFNETRAGELALLATEAAQNVLVHGGGGQVLLTGAAEGAGATARVVAIDQGPGIANVAEAMNDGFSTAGTMGGGLGAMKRMSTTLEIFTGRGGTILMAELTERAHQALLPLAGFVVPYPGETVSGDAWHAYSTRDRTIVIIADGLGHGMGAADAAQEAIAIFRKRQESSPAQILEFEHDALRKTRGAVAAVAEIRRAEGTLLFAGVGNISAVILSPGGSRRLLSHNGTLGAFSPRIQEYRCEWPSGAVLVLHSDGLHSRWDLDSYSGLISRHPAVIGGALLRDFRRERDDASVVVVKAA